MATKNCQCGAGLPRRALRDANTNLLVFACDRCEPYKRAFLGPVVASVEPVGGEAPLVLLADTHDKYGHVSGRDRCLNFLADRHGDYADLM